MSYLTPRETVNELDKHIIGQDDAKRAVAIALRNRWRRSKVEGPMQDEIVPKNILMIGPTGVGKTEIARRLAKLVNAPFIKIEATKFTEVGYVGRDVETIIRDLVDMSVKLTRESEMEKVRTRAEEAAEERLLDILVRPPEKTAGFEGEPDTTKKDSTARQTFRKKLREGELEEMEIEMDVLHSSMGVEIMAPPGMEEMTSQLQSMFQNIGGDKKKTRKLKIKEARKILAEEESSKLLDNEDIKLSALKNAEQNGIVFIDELDKVCKRAENVGGGDVSREGVQRDLLPLVEGCTVSTKYGIVKTDHILFIASGAFHLAKPSDLIPELQGRLPIRVELKSLSVEDFTKILTETSYSLTQQYEALLGTENFSINFENAAINRIAEVAWRVNESTENIGARRLHTVMERLLEDVSFTATDDSGKSLAITAEYVDKQLKDLFEDEDLSRYIL